MGSDRAEMVRRFFDLTYRASGPAPDAYEGFVDDFDYAPVAHYPESRPVSGLDGYMAWNRSIVAAWGEMDVEMRSIEEHEDALIARVRIRVEASSTRPPLEGGVFAVFWFRGDQVVGRHDYLTSAEARRAAAEGFQRRA